MIQKTKKLTLLILIAFGWVFSVLPVNELDAAIADIGHWRDSVGGQIPGTTFGGFDFDQQIRNDGIFTKPNDSTIEFDEAGTYLITATMRDFDSSNGRYQQQARAVLTSGTGDLFTSYYTGYSRNNTEDTSWSKLVAVLVNGSVDAQVEIQRRRDADAPTGGSVAGASDLQAVRINPTNYGIYDIGGNANTLGGTTPNTVTIDRVVDESDTAAIEGSTFVGTNTITIKGNNKRYLVAWSVSMDGANNSRTQRIGHLEYDGVDELPTRAYCYTRNASNEYCGLGSMDILETGTADRAIQVEVFRGPGIAADQGGANVDGAITTDGNGQLIVIELPDDAEVFRSHDSTGLQNITGSTTLNAVRDLDFNDAASFTKASDTAIDVTSPADIFTWGNVWAARNNVASGTRLTSYGSITIAGVEQSTGRHGNYSRGNQSSTDTFALGFNPGGIFTTSAAGDDIGINIDRITGGGGGGADRTQPNTVGFFGINLDSLVPPLASTFDQSVYRFYANDDSTDVGAPLAAQDTPATLGASGDDFRLRTLVEVGTANLPQNSGNFKLQFAEQAGTCDTSFVGETYADVSASSLIAYNDNPTPADGSNLTANANDPINGGNTIVNQSYEELNNFTNSVATINAGQDGKWDYSLIDNGAPANTTYCLRVVNSDGSPLDTYTGMPEVTTANTVSSPGPGGTIDALRTWLKANLFSSVTTSTDGSNVTLWEDQSVGGHDYSPSGNAPDFVDNGTNNINFNQTVNFDSAATEGLQTANSADYNTGTSVRKIINMNFQTGSNITARQQLFEEGGTTRGIGVWILNGDLYASIWNRAETAPLGDWNNSGLIDTVNTALSPNTDYIVSCEYDGDSSGVTQNGTFDCYLNGENFGTLTSLGQLYNHTDGIGIGYSNGVSLFEDGSSSGGNYFNGDIAEFAYQHDPTSVTILQRNKTESYLALKYGITLDQTPTSGGTDYIDSAGTTYWNEDVNDIYEHDIFGLARDDNSEFNQRIAQSSNSDAIITIALDNDFISPNNDVTRSTAHANDLQYLVLANNDDPLALQMTEIDTGVYPERIGREWQIQKTANFTQTVNLKFDGYDETYDLLMDADGDFSTGAVSLGALDTNGEITGVDLFNTQYLTLASNVNPQTLSFDISDNTIGFGTLSSAETRYANGSGTGTIFPFSPAHTISASTNAVNGYTININGTNLRCVSCNPQTPIIDAVSGFGFPTSGVEQFGVNGSVASGTGSVLSPYGSSYQYAYSPLTEDEILSGDGDDVVTVFDMNYIGNISSLTDAGNYEAVITYTITANY